MIRYFYKLLVFFSSILFCFVLFLVAMFSYIHYWSGLSHGSLENVEVKFIIPKGVTLASLSKSLEENSLVSSANSFRIWARVFSKFSDFKAGEYLISQPITPVDLAQKFIEGSSYREVKYEVSIPEGFSLKSIIEKFVSHGIGNRQRFYDLSTNRYFLSSIGVTTNSIEGYLYPATYPFHEKPSEEEVFAEMVKVFWKKLPKNYESLVASRGLNLYQAITFASLIEAEAYHDDERSSISEVIWNRLNSQMPLGIDASVIYGIKDFDGDIKKSDLNDSDNPYNLRLKRGLPPTPINTPTLNSLSAVLTPTNNGYLFYVVDPEKEKRHTFTKTLGDHNIAVSKLLNRK
jgi:UPF0755 protein